LRIGIVGPTYQQRSLPFNAERSVNLFPVFDQQGKEVSAMYGTPGLELFSTCGVGPIRGGFSSSNGRAFFVSDSRLFEITSDGAATSRGSLNQSSGYVTIAENDTQLAICDGIKVYIFTYATNNFQIVTDSDLPNASTICYLDGYFIISELDSDRFYISDLQNGLSWNALQFATAESSPDKLVALFRPPPLKAPAPAPSNPLPSAEAPAPLAPNAAPNADPMPGKMNGKAIGAIFNIDLKMLDIVGLLNFLSSLFQAL